MNLENWDPPRLSVSNIFPVRALCGSGRVSFSMYTCLRSWAAGKKLKRNEISHYCHLEFHQMKWHLVPGDMENNLSISRSYVEKMVAWFSAENEEVPDSLTQPNAERRLKIRFPLFTFHSFSKGLVQFELNRAVRVSWKRSCSPDQKIQIDVFGSRDLLFIISMPSILKVQARSILLSWSYLDHTVYRSGPHNTMKSI